MKCIKCEKEFDPTPYAIRVFDHRCRECRLKYQKEWRTKRIAQGLPVRGARTWDPEKKKAYFLNRVKTRDQMDRENALKRERRKRPDVKRKDAARSFVAWKKHTGELKSEPCAFCGVPADTQAHHVDYDKPLLLVWLCPACHLNIHYKKEA